MAEMAMRLGDLIDDYCPRCKLLLNHDVASLMGEEVAKVICKTCYTEHPFLHAKAPAKKPAGKGKMTLFDQVLANMPTESAAPATPSRKPKATPEARYVSRGRGHAPTSRK